MQQDRINTLQKGNHFKEALKRATLEYSSESKKRDGKSAAKIAAEIKLQHDGVRPDARMITRYVNEYNHVGMSPIKTGVKSNIPHWAFLSLCTAFETYIAINQLNGAQSLNRRNKLSKILNAIFDIDPCPNQPNHWLVKRVTAATAIDLRATKAENAEERRIKWTTYKNLDMWFDNWISDLVKLGFATKLKKDDPNDCNIHIPDEQMARIMNFDETCCSLDGCAGTRGGRPEVTFYNPHLPQLGIGTSKSADDKRFPHGCLS